MKIFFSKGRTALLKCLFLLSIVFFSTQTACADIPPPSQTGGASDNIALLGLSFCLLLSTLYFWYRRHRLLQKHSLSVLMRDSIFSTLPVHLLITNRAGEILFSSNNPGIKGKRIRDVYGEEDQKSLLHEVGTVLSRVADWHHFEFYSASAGKNYSAMGRRIDPALFGADAILFVLNDITAETRNKESLQAILTALDEAIIVTNPEGKISVFNPAAERLTGYTVEEAMGRHVCEISHPLRRSSFSEDMNHDMLGDAISKGQIVRAYGEADLVAKDGTRHSLAECLAPITGPDGKPAGVVIAMRDITQELAREQNLEVTCQRLEVASQWAKLSYFTAEADGTITSQIGYPLPFGKGDNIEAWFPMIDETVRDEVKGAFDAIFRDQKDEVVLHFTIPGEKTCYFDLQLAGKQGEDGEVFCMGTLQDVTDLRRLSLDYQETNILLEEILDNIPAAVYVKDANGFRFIRNNQVHADQVGSTKAELIGKTDFDFHTQADAERFQISDKLAVETDEVINIVEPLFLKDGTWINTIKRRCTFQNGRACVIGLSFDVTETQKQAKELEYSNAIMEALLKNMPTAVLVKKVDDTGGRYCVWNKQAEKDFHIPAQDAIGKTAGDFTAFAGILDKIEDEVAHTSYTNEDAFCYDCTIGGRTFTLLKKALTIANERYIMTLASDITEHVAAQEDLKNALAAAKKAEESKGFFLATMSHELRTPLNAVIGFSELLQSGRNMPEPERTNTVDSIHFAAKTLLELINNVLDFSKIEAGRFSLAPEPLVIAPFLRDVISLFRQRAASAGLTLSLVINEELPAAFMLDHQRVRQILLNLIGNALKFTKEGGVTLSAEYRDETLILIVEDTGVGIPPESLSQLFRPFEQLDKPDSRSLEGTGLGLVISLHLAQLMGGGITVESQLGKGSRFIVRIRDTYPVAVTEGVDSKSSNDTVLELPDEIRSKRLFILDDVAMNLSVLSAMLDRIGIAYRAFSNMEDLCAALAEDQPDAILTDLWMPGCSGADLVNRFRSLTSSDLPIVIVTADTQYQPDPALALAGILYKPVTLLDLYHLLLRVFDRAPSAG